MDKNLEILNKLLINNSPLIGDNFFNSIVKELNNLIGADYTFIGKFIKERKIKTLAICSSNELLENIVYELNDTPCANVSLGNVCVYPHDIVNKFPQDYLLKEMDIEGYAGVPLLNSKKVPIGVFVALFKKCISNSSFITLSLNLFAQKAANEIERIEIENELINKNKKLKEEVAARKKAEINLRSTNRRLRKAENLARLGNWENNLIDNTLIWSDEVFIIFGEIPQSFEPTYDKFREYIHPEDIEYLEQTYFDSIKNHKEYFVTHRIINSIGKVCYVEERGKTIYDEKSNPITTFGTVLDVTEKHTYQDKILGVYLSALVHDIGKIGIRIDLLEQVTPLTEDEFDEIKKHSQFGFEIFSNVEFPWPIKKIILQHHENNDGSGYPFGLKGYELLEESKIIRICDTFEAVINDRPYRKALGLDKAIDILENGSGSLYDKKIISVLLGLIKSGEYDFKKAPEHIRI